MGSGYGFDWFGSRVSGLASEATGDDFWRGFAVGAIVASANHVAHGVASEVEKARIARIARLAAQQVGGGITVLDYDADYSDPRYLGVFIRLGFNDPNEQFSEYGWIQTVRTNALNSYSQSSPFNDTPGDGVPYYTFVSFNTDGFKTIMVDYPGRSINFKSVFWRAELTIGGIKNGVFVPLRTMTYGFDINQGKLTVIPLKVAQPSPWHLDSFTNKTKW
ncbi:hypothetical protein [Chryseolinea serpens]|uniref:hypothetical protein n=1 Tax=Chryseolinea serpens TaxID=947013 RepID=UPI00116140D6|nr:hypothetical protein [Chryseolinea serpens]